MVYILQHGTEHVRTGSYSGGTSDTCILSPKLVATFVGGNLHHSRSIGGHFCACRVRQPPCTETRQPVIERSPSSCRSVNQCLPRIEQNNEQDDEFGLDEDDERVGAQRARRSGKPLTGKLKKGEKDPWWVKPTLRVLRKKQFTVFSILRILLDL